jgi:phenylpropionate dioxygenase-like ring-hydroxylating dioxygenase large terminal subunit
VPQSSTPERICGLQASAAAAHPCSERQGLIWVWPAAGPAAAADAASRPPVLVPEVEDASWWQAGPWLQRDAPLAFEFLQENAIDVSHTPFTHHGLFSRREDAVSGALLAFFHRTLLNAAPPPLAAAILGAGRGHALAPPTAFCLRRQSSSQLT